jgi:hypothetical protein
VVFLDLIDLVEGGAIAFDDALRELQSREVVDAAGFTWRIDPLTRSFIRRGPGEASWRAADPEKYVSPGAPAAELEPDVTASASLSASSDMPAENSDDGKHPDLLRDLGFGVDARNPAVPHRKRGLMYLVACGALVLFILVAAVGTHRPTRPAIPRSRSTPSPSPSQVVVIIPPPVTASTPSS